MKFHWEAIQRLAKAHHAEDPVATLETFRRFLEFWWCRHYSRPLKDPLLKDYTLDELTYEYLRHFYSIPENDPKKDLKQKVVKEEDDQWVRQMLAQVAEQAAAKKVEPKAEESPKASDDVPQAPEISTTFDVPDEE